MNTQGDSIVASVKSTFRLLAALRSLKLIGTEVFKAATVNNKVAKLVISGTLDP